MSDNHKDQSIEFEYTFENRIKRAETQMGDRTAFFYGKRPLPSCLTILSNTF
jgi:hypothetical protein